jgi:hypothetical protein
MLDLYNNKYSKEMLKKHIYALKFIDVLKTQTIDAKFAVRYILNNKYQFHEDDIVTPNMVLFYQRHITKKSLINEIVQYDSDDDSVEDFLSVSNK